MGLEVGKINFNIIVAFDKNRGIGINGGLPWDIASELKYFQQTTTRTKDSQKQNAVIMGRKTWESIPIEFRPLPGRKNIVISKKNLHLPNGVLKADSIHGGIWLAALFKTSVERVFIIGGASIYRQAVNMLNCKKIYATEIQDEYNCDVYFPNFRSKYELKTCICNPGDPDYINSLYERIEDA